MAKGADVIDCNLPELYEDRGPRKLLIDSNPASPIGIGSTQPAPRIKYLSSTLAFITKIQLEQLHS